MTQSNEVKAMIDQYSAMFINFMASTKLDPPTKYHIMSDIVTKQMTNLISVGVSLSILTGAPDKDLIENELKRLMVIVEGQTKFLVSQLRLFNMPPLGQA